MDQAPLPIRHRPLHRSKRRVRKRSRAGSVAARSGRISDFELPEKVLPLKEQLPGTYLRRSGLVGADDLRRVKVVAPVIRF